MEQILNNRYELLSQIQEGGFGITWLALDRKLDIHVAVKEYINTDSSGQKAFFKEARKLAKYSKEPGIVNVRDYMEQDGKAYLVMEYLSGEDLSTKISREGPLSFKQTWNMMLPLLTTLQRLHEDGLIHRDISPDNIRLLPNGAVKLLDFGSALEMGQDSEKTITKAVKPGYAPYEQYMARSMQGSWTDVYAVCATIYKCITGITPPDSLQREFHDELLSPVKQGASISTAEEAVLLRGMAIKPEDRIFSVTELIRKITQVHDETDRSSLSEEKSHVKPNTISQVKEHTLLKRDDLKVSVESNVDHKSDVTKKKKKRTDKTGIQKQSKTNSSNKKRKKIFLAFALIALFLVVGVTGIHYSQTRQTTISTNQSFSGETVTAKQIKKLSKSITSVDFWNCELSEEVFQEFAKSEQVESVLIHNCTGFTSLSPLSSMKNLKRLRFNQGSQADTTDTSLLFTEDFSKLESLTITLVCNQDDGTFLTHFPNLKELILRTEGLTSLAFLEKMPALETLRIGSEMNLSGDISEDIAFCKNLKYFNGDNTELDTLSFAEELYHLTDLSAKNCEITDLSPLKNHEDLKNLTLSDNQISDLSPLASCISLRKLDLSNNEIASIESLAATSISSLYLNNNQITDLLPLSALSSLQTVEVNHNHLTSLKGLENSKETISWVSAKDNEIRDISALTGCNSMHYLWLSDNQIDNLDPCKEMIELVSIYADHNQIADVNALNNSTELKTISLSDNQITDISFLENHFSNLQVLNLSDNQVVSLKSLSGCDSLSVLIAGNNHISSLEGLENKTALYGLLVNHNEIRSLDPIKDCASKLLYADFGNNQLTDVSELSALSGKKIELFLENNQITDISMLPTDRSFAYLTLYGNPLKDISVIKSIENVSTFNDTLYIGFSAYEQMTPLIESRFGKSHELRIIDCPVSEQGRFLQQLRDVHTLVFASFITSEEADEELKEYRASLLKDLLGEDSEDEEEAAEEDEAGADDETETEKMTGES